ncbi:hypothetical protein F5883DRAFT_583661 [Diaporthe sp. PMI_573]|nr:hypothetical protein F5883DRAFT_583661 [Diaporthaceae sp. PMI_573]
MSAQSPPQVRQRNDPSAESPPDGGYGWIVVCSCFVFNCFTWGVTAVSLCPLTHLLHDDPC